MSKSSFGVISSELTYTSRELANVLGKSEAKVKEFIRAHVQYTEPMEGLILVSGRLFNFAIEELSRGDTPEDREARRRKAGHDTRRAKAAEKAKEAAE